MHLNASWVSGRLEHLEAGEGKLRQDKISLETRWDSSLWDGPGRRHSEKDVLICFYVIESHRIASWAIVMGY